MFKQVLNECILTVEIEPADPILIKSGFETVDGPDMSFVRTHRRGKDKPDYYLPGSSLKGVFRSHTERIDRTVRGNRPCVCIPFARKNNKGQLEPPEAKKWWEEGCGARFDREKKAREQKKEQESWSEIVYRNSCPACRLFGSTSMQGRVSFGDAYPDEKTKVVAETRDGVGIDRFTGGASRGAKFNLEVITAGKFVCRVDLRNFELWQLGWLAYALWDLREEAFWIGSGKSRGLGRVKGNVKDATLAFLGAHRPPDGTVWGVGSCFGEANARPYGFRQPDEVQGDLGPYTRQGVRSRLQLDTAGFWRLAEKVTDRWDKFVESYERQEKIQ